MTNDANVRVLRVLEYTGTREWVEKTLQARRVKGQVRFGGVGTIREALVGEFPEPLESSLDLEENQHLRAVEEDVTIMLPRPERISRGRRH